MLENYLDQNEITVLEQFDEFMLEHGLPVAIANDPTKYVTLSEYTKFNLKLINILYSVENQLKRSTMKLNREIAERYNELKLDGLTSASSRDQALLAGNAPSTTKILELQNSSNELDSIKWLIKNKMDILSSILRLY